MRLDDNDYMLYLVTMDIEYVVGSKRWRAQSGEQVIVVGRDCGMITYTNEDDRAVTVPEGTFDDCLKAMVDVMGLQPMSR